MTTMKERRKNLGISQIDLAREVGVSLLTLQLWEKNVAEPKEENARRLEQVLTKLENDHLKKLQNTIKTIEDQQKSTTEN